MPAPSISLFTFVVSPGAKGSEQVSVLCQFSAPLPSSVIGSVIKKIEELLDCWLAGEGERGEESRDQAKTHVGLCY